VNAVTKTDWNDIARTRGREGLRIVFDKAVAEAGIRKIGSAIEVASELEVPDEALRFESVALWHGQPIPDREWAVKNRIPARNVTLLSGEGAAGKTLLTQQLAVACSLDNDWLGVRPSPGPFMGLYCEDDRDELHRRFASIAAHYNTTLAALPELHALSFAGRDAILAVPDRSGVIQPTDLFTWLMGEAKRIKPKILTIDNAADVYAGNENDRAQVRQFIGLLRRLAIEANTAVLLTAHPSLTGLNTGSGISGSTGWHASVRARMYRKKAKAEGDERADPNERILEVMKSNYGPAGETVSLYWKDGLFVPTESANWLDKRVAENGVDDLFLRLLAQFDGQGRAVSHTVTAPTYAPTMFERDPSAATTGIKKAAFAKAMARLFAASKIHVENYGRPSRPNSKIVAGPTPK